MWNLTYADPADWLWTRKTWPMQTGCGRRQWWAIEAAAATGVPREVEPALPVQVMWLFPLQSIQQQENKPDGLFRSHVPLAEVAELPWEPLSHLPSPSVRDAPPGRRRRRCTETSSDASGEQPTPQRKINNPLV